MAANPLNVKRRMVSKSFHRILDTYSRQTFTGRGGVVALCVCICVEVWERGWVRMRGARCTDNRMPT